MDSVHFSQRTSSASTIDYVTGAEVTAEFVACRALVRVAAMSLAPVEETLAVNQFRSLVIIISPGPLDCSGLPEATGLHPSNATRMRDLLFAEGLLDLALQPRGSPAPAADADRGR